MTARSTFCRLSAIAVVAVCVAASALADDPSSKTEEPKPKRGDAKNVAVAINDLKQLALGMHNYESAYGRLPPAAVRDKDGKPLLSWRVLLLPYLEQDKLYKQFKLEEPWDSEHNKKLIAKMPAILRGPNRKLNEEGKTAYLVPVEKNSMFPPDGRKVSLANIYDGTSNTIMLVEANDDAATIWTKPDDLIVNRKSPRDGLVRPGQEFFLVGMGDGSVHRFRNDADATNLVRVFDTQDGEVIDYTLLAWKAKDKK